MTTIYLKSSDNQVFSMEEAGAKLSLKLKGIIEDKNHVGNNFIKIDDVKGITLTKVINYCSKHVISKDDAEALKLFDQDFVKNEDVVSMMFMADAAMKLEIKSLFDLFYPALIEKLKGKTLHEIFDMVETEDLGPVAGVFIDTVLVSLGLKK